MIRFSSKYCEWCTFLCWVIKFSGSTTSWYSCQQFVVGDILQVFQEVQNSESNKDFLFW